MKVLPGGEEWREGHPACEYDVEAAQYLSSPPQQAQCHLPPQQMALVAHEAILSEEEICSTSNLRKVVLQSWTNHESDPSYVHMNLPPLVNSEHEEQRVTKKFHKMKGILTFVSDVGSISGSLFFSIGSVIGYGLTYGFVPISCGLTTCGMVQSIMAVIGATFFTITPAATFILTDAVSFSDVAMSYNSMMYIIGGFFYVLGAFSYVPFSFSTATDHVMTITYTIGASLYVLGSVIYVVAVIWDIYRARLLRDKSDISLLTFMIESWVTALYLLGSLMLLLGSIFSYPDLYTPHIYAMFLSGSFCFLAGTISGFGAQLWRYTRNVLNRQQVLLSKIAVIKQLKKSTSQLRSSAIRKSNSAPDLMRNMRRLSFSNQSLKVAKQKLKPRRIAVSALSISDAAFDVDGSNDKHKDAEQSLCEGDAEKERRVLRSKSFV